MRTLFDPPARPEFNPPSALTPRPYQTDAVDAVYRELADKDSTLVGLPTGCGKTVVFGLAADRWLREQQGDVLVLAHREELIFQARDELAPLVGFQPAVEMAEMRAGTNSRAVVASVQSLWQPNRLKEFGPDRFGLIVVDECHHATKVARTYWNILEYFKSAKLLGVTATARRGDGIPLGDVFSSVAYHMGIEDAVSGGWLVPVRQQFVQVAGVDLAPVGTVAGDLNQGHLAAVMNAPEVVKRVAAATVEHCGSEPTLIFTVDVEQAEQVAAVLNAIRSGSAVALSGKTPGDDRRKWLAAYSRGEFQYLVGCALFTEGFNEPRISRVVMARPTKSIVYYCLDSQTEILTDRGWVGYGQWDAIDDGRRAAGYDLATGKVVWTDVKAKYRRPISPGEKMYELRSGQTDVRVSEAHRLLYRPATERRASDLFRLTPASELAARRSEYEIPVSGVQDTPGVPLTDEELRFVGWYMTDGTVNKTTGQFLLRQAAHQPWIPQIHDCLRGCGFKYGFRRYTRTTQFKANAETVEFYVSKGKPRGTEKDKRGWGALEPYMSKDLSPTLEDVTPDQLAVLLEAMHLGDGAKQAGQAWTRRSYHIVTGNKVMADRLQSLCVRRGFRCSLSADSAGREKPLYGLHIKRCEARYVGGTGYTDRPTLKESPTTFGEVLWCITTGTSTIITRRNGKVTVMGQTQAVGRGTRTLRGVLRPDMGTPDERRAAIAASRKPDLLVLDFVGNSGRHKLVSCVDIFAGESRRAAVADRVRVAAEKSGKPVEVSSALTAAEEDIRKADRRKAERSAARVSARVDYTARDVDPFGYSDGVDRAKAKQDRGGRATTGQLEFLKQHGGIVKDGMSMAAAGAAIVDVKRRLKGGLCSQKQERVLRRNGIEGEVSRASAKALIDLLAARGWRRMGYDLQRDQLSIRRADGGYRLTVADPTAGEVPVGAVYATPADVRAAYRDLCPEPAAV